MRLSTNSKRRFPLHGLVILCCLLLAVPNIAGVPIAFKMPHDGHVTIAINDASGIRVRNLIADVVMKKGTHTITWDGRDDNGQLAPAGSYRWVGLTRKDLHVVYRGACTYGVPPWNYGETGGWTGDHTGVSALVSVEDRIICGCFIVEDSSGIFGVDLDGKKQFAATWLNHMNWAGADSMVTDGERVFACPISEWKAQDRFRVYEVDPTSGKSWYVVSMPKPEEHPQAPFDNIGGLRVVGAHRTGTTRWDGELYVCDVLGTQPRTFVYSTARNPEATEETGYDSDHPMKYLRVLPVRIWGMTWLPDGRCIVALDASIAELDTQTGNVIPLNTGDLQMPMAITSDTQGRLYVADWGGPAKKDNEYSHRFMGVRTSPTSSMQVKVFDGTGKLLRTMGRLGGYGVPAGNYEQVGPIDTNDFYQPISLAIDKRGRLWVAERTVQPKRVSVWEIPNDITNDAPKLAREFFGRPQYGEGVFMMNPETPNLLLSNCQGVVWDMNLTDGTYRPLARQFYYNLCGGLFAGIPVKPVTVNGHTYATLSRWGYAQPVMGEIREGLFHPLFSMGTISGFFPNIPEPLKQVLRDNPQWETIAKKAGIDPTMAKLPDDQYRWPAALNGYQWTDANGDGEWQTAEITLFPMQYYPPINFMYDKQLNLIVSPAEHLFRVKLKGLNAIGAPLYDWSDRVGLDANMIGAPTEIGDDGTILISRGENSKLLLISQDGCERWSYLTRYPGNGYFQVPKERLLDPGAIYASDTIQGIVNGPEGVGKFFMLHGWHGMNYLLTRDDGLFIGTVFKPETLAPNFTEIADAKPGMLLDNYSLGGENFGGSIAQAQQTINGFERGHYYLLGMGANLVLELTGMDTVKRLPGAQIYLSPAQVSEGRRAVLAQAKAKWQVQEQLATVDIPPTKNTPVLVEIPNTGWQAMQTQFWHTPQGLGLRVTCLDIGGSGCSPELTLANTATDWWKVYVEGNSVDLQVLSKQAGITGPQRMVFALVNNTLVTVRYRRMPVDRVPLGGKVLPIGRQGNSVWVAEKLELSDCVIRRSVFANEASVTYEVVLPWEILGLTYSPALQFRGNIGCTLTRSGKAGRGVIRPTWVGDTSAAAVDFASALEMSPTLWGTFALRPDGYKSPPDVTRAKPAATTAPLPVRDTRDHAGDPARYAGAVTWATWTGDGLQLKWYVSKDTSPFMNRGTDWTAIFKSGDGCDLQIASPTLGKCRYVFAMFEDKPVVVRFRYDARDEGKGITYASPVSTFYVPLVEKLPITPTVERGDDWYTIEVLLPWTMLEIKPHGGSLIPVEFGVLRSDASGTKTIQRDYWSSGLSGMVNDVPSEVRPTSKWGALLLEDKRP